MDKTHILSKTLINTLFFILGFTTIFVLLGAGASSFSFMLNQYKNLISVIGGIIIIIFSIQIMGLFNIPFLNFEKRTLLRSRPRGIVGAFIIGITFAAAWTPCIGPILSSILILAATKDTALRGIILLTAYSFGLGIQFLFAVAAYGYFISLSDFMKKHFKTIKLLSGLLLLGIGIILILGQFSRLTQFLAVIPGVSLIEGDNLSILIAVMAGFVSFISPCVLPLIPTYLTYITGVSVTEIER